MNMKTLLDVEIEERSIKLAKLEPGTKEYSDAVDALAKLMDRRLEIEKLEMSEVQSEKQIEENRKAREEQMKEERIGRLVKNLIDIGLGVAGIAVTVWGAKASFRFEETGTITSQAGKKLMDRIFRR